MPEVSIIVPVYNGEAWLEQCTRDISAQQFTDFECILVDDGSTDRSLSMCNRVARADPRFRVLHKKNGGVSSARNAGIKACIGKYILFLDCDDRYSPSLLKTALLLQQEYLDSIIGWRMDETNDETFSALPGPSLHRTYTKDTWLSYRQQDLVNYSSVSLKLWPRDFLLEYHLFFNETLFCWEDQDFMQRAFHEYFTVFPHGSFVEYSAVLIHYRHVNPHSLIRTSIPFRKAASFIFGFSKKLVEEYEFFYQAPPEQIASVLLEPIEFIALENHHSHLSLTDKRFIWRSGLIKPTLLWLKKHRLYSYYYLPLRVHSLWAVEKMRQFYANSPNVFWRIYWLGYYLFCRGWKHL